MTGGLSQATQFLLHPFLRDHFARLGGAPNVPEDSLTPTVNRLRKRARTEADFNLTSELERGALADLIVKAARTLKRPMDYVSYSDLKISWTEYCDAYWQKQRGGSDQQSAVDSQQNDYLEECLIEMRHRQMIFQGHRWTCWRCHHRNWVDLSSLSPSLVCEVCKQQVRAPVDIRWLFRPNEFLIESLRDHSVLSLLWTLAALVERSRSSFIFVEPMWIGFERDRSSPDAEADLMILLDGQAILCEVKSSWHGLRPSHVADFVSLARRLRPDTAILSVMEGATGSNTELAAARAELATEQIEFELLTLDSYPPRDDPYLLA